MSNITTDEFTSIFADGLPQFLEILPPVVRERLQVSSDLERLIEVVLDYGRPAEIRFRDSVERMQNVIVTELDIDYVVKSIGEFGEDNRAGIERTLHRVSCIRNRTKKIVGLTCRVGRALEGTIDIIDDIVRSGKSILLLGRPGVGKTTKLREVARVLADEVHMRVIIVDTSNEIAGDGDVPHPAIGNARRMQVPRVSEQYNVMIEAVENHMPEAIIIDEIGNEAEAAAARTINERGVQLVGTAHGQTLENLMLNPALADLIGGIQAVTLSDDEAKRRGTQKTVLERKAPPTFDVVIELLDYDRLAVHHNVMKTVDLILRGVPPRPEIRVRTEEGEMQVVQEEMAPDMDVPGFNERFPSLSKQPEAVPLVQEKGMSRRTRIDEEPVRVKKITAPKVSTATFRVYPYGIAKTRLERAIRERNVNAVMVADIAQADGIIAIRTTYQNRPTKLKDLHRQIPIEVVKSNTFSQIAAALENLVKAGTASQDAEEAALLEVQSGIAQLQQTAKPVNLSPQNGRARKLQHDFLEGKHIRCESIGEEPNRFIRLLPGKLM
ncbi:MAG: AAA family ATPase [Armatimonadetes bacterium]|nr:AAA family ATPase [Armatimonadota bacterium]